MGRTVSGRVLEAEQGQALEGAWVSVVGPSTNTDARGLPAVRPHGAPEVPAPLGGDQYRLQRILQVLKEPFCPLP